MEYDVKKEARKQYFHYFRIWFIILAVVAVIALIASVLHTMAGETTRGNYEGGDRVFDYADVMTDYEEQQLAEYIAECEEQYHMDIVVVTINEDVESIGYWDSVMRNTADDFYDNGNYGYDKVHGDGVLFLDNWYTDANGSQKGTWLSTCGNVYVNFSDYDIDSVLTQVDIYIDLSPLEAYKAGINRACSLYDSYENGTLSIPVILIIFAPIIVAVIFALSKLKQTPARDTTTSELYVEAGSRKMNVQADDFIRKSVHSVRISTDSESSSGGGSGGHGGGHVSSGGVSHGGGGHRR